MSSKAQKWVNKTYSQKKKSITELKISDKNFNSSNSSLNSLNIDGFMKLEIIDLKNLKLTSLKISNCSRLTKISLSEHNSNLEIRNCSKLNEVKLSRCQIKKLSVNDCPKLTTLDCPGSELTSLVLSNQLTELNISNLSTSKLKISRCSELNEVKFSECRIVSLFMSGCPKLTKLNCPSSELTSLDLSNLALKKFNCSGNKLTGLEISNLSTNNLEINHCSELIKVKLSKCRIKSLSVSDCPKLKKLDCPRSGLTELDISNLIELNCSHNKIKDLNLNLCPEITTLNCSDNELNALEISNCSKLKVLNCHNNQLTSLDISKCPKLKNPESSENFIKTSNPNLIINTKGEEARNLLIVGRTGGGKSTLANVLSDTDYFKESGFSVSETRNFQKIVFKYEGAKYRVVDTIGVGDTKLTKKKVLYKIAEGIYSMPEGISRVLIVFNGRLTTEEVEMFKLFKDVILESGVVKYTTIVRTKFDQFQSKNECEKDRGQLLMENEEIANIVELCDIVHVDNPPIIIPTSDDEQETLNEIHRNRRKKSRSILLERLEDKIKNKENYKFKTWDKLRDEIDDYMKKTGSNDTLFNDASINEPIDSDPFPSLPRFLKKFIEKYLNNRKN